ncbi:hypothetical protein [Ekhidna sp.]
MFNLTDNTEQTLYGAKASEKNYLNSLSESPIFSYSTGWSVDDDKIVFTKAR